MKLKGHKNASDRKSFSETAKSFDRGLSRPSGFPLLLSLWLLLAAALLADLLLPQAVLLAWFTIPALIAAIFFPARSVAPLAAGALVCALLSGFDAHVLATPAYELRLGAVAMVGILSVVLAAVHDHRLKSGQSGHTLHGKTLREIDAISRESDGQIQELEMLARQLMQRQEEQQHRISRELHDNIAQVLTAVTTRISLAGTTPQMPAWLKQELGELQDHLNTALTDLHTLARGLRPALLDHCGFAAALEKHTRDFRERTNIDFELRVDPDATRDFNPENLTHLFRLVQESMRNIEKHSGATRAWLNFGERDGEILLEIGDNGRSFTGERVAEAQRDGHLGLLGMRERAELLRGSFRLEAVPLQGTTIRVIIPPQKRR